MKKISLALFGLLLLAEPAAQAQFTYTTNAGAITITGYTGGSGAVVIPTNINGLPVTSVADGAFEGAGLTSVTIPGSVKGIGNEAFEDCTNLTDVTMAKGVATIGDYAFYDCTNLTDATIPDSVVSIGDGAFEDCESLIRVAIPGSVTVIGEEAFYDCESLTNVTMAKGVIIIGDYAFYDCYSLASVTIPGSVTSIGEEAFEECGLTRVAIPGSVATIGEDAFYDCESLTNLTLADGVAVIGEDAFEDCYRLASVTIPASVVSIGEDAFYESGLTHLTIANGVTRIGYYAFDYCYKLGSVTIPGSVTSIGEGAFYDCTNLSRLRIADGVASIGEEAFEDCYSLTSVTIPGSVVSIGEDAFEDSGVTRLTIASGVTSIGDYAFEDCYRLGSVTIPGSVTSIGEGAFYDCTSLTNVTMAKGVVNIAEDAFEDCSSLASVTIPGSVANIEDSAFEDCASLTNVFFQGNAPTAESDVFYNDPDARVYYLPHTTGWGPVFAGLPAVVKDTQQPTNEITAPVAGEMIKAAAFVIEGSAGDNVAVSNVYYNLNGTGWQPAMTQNGFAYWYAYVSLAPDRTNTLSAYAVDTSGNHSATNGPVKFVCTAAGFAPMSIAGEWCSVTNATNANDSFEMSFGAAAYALLNTNGTGAGEVGTYTYMPTGSNTAELAPLRVLPTPEAGTNGSLLELTFTDAYNASFTDNSGGSGTIFFISAEESVPMTLDGDMLAFSTNSGGSSGTNVYGSATFTNGGAGYGGTYTFTPITPVAALVVGTFTSPPALVGTTNYGIISFTEGASPSGGVYFSENVDASGGLGSGIGSFTLSTNAVTAKFVGPATLAGLQAKVTPEGAAAFTRSFGEGTFAGISMATNGPVDVGIVLANTRVSTNTGAVTFLALAPPYAVGMDDGTDEVTWKSRTNGTFTVAASNTTGKVTFSKAAKYAPAALSGHKITAPQTGTRTTATTKFTYNIFSDTQGNSGAYTYAPYTPTMALLHFIPTNGSNTGDVEYLLLNYQSSTAGTCVGSKLATNDPGNWTFTTGVFTME
jgi:hypothetical protein